MTLHIAKRSLVWALLSLLCVCVAAALLVPLWAASRAHMDSANIARDSDGLIQRRQALAAQIDALSARAWTEPIAATGAADAVNQLEGAIRASLSAGEVLELDIRPVREGVVEARLHWRGTEVQMRSGLEALAGALPHAALAQIAIRTSETAGGDVEVTGVLRQGWEEAR